MRISVYLADCGISVYLAEIPPPQIRWEIIKMYILFEGVDNNFRVLNRSKNEEKRSKMVAKCVKIFRGAVRRHKEFKKYCFLVPFRREAANFLGKLKIQDGKLKLT